MNNLHSFFQRELGFSFIEEAYIKNALLRIRDKKNYPDSLDITCEFPESGIITITFYGWDFIETENGDQRETNYTDEEFFEDVKEFSNLITLKQR